MRTLPSAAILAAVSVATTAAATAQGICPLFPLEPVNALIGGLHESGLDIHRGFVAARVFSPNAENIEVRLRTAPSWAPAEVIPRPGTFSSGFGLAIDLETEFFGLELMATAPGSQHMNGPGVVYRYVRTPTGWSPLPEFRTADPDAQFFATNLARDLGIAAVQSQAHFFASTESHVHLFEPLGAITWVETARIDHPVPGGDSSAFGSAMDVDDGLIVISSQEQPRGRVWVWHHATGGTPALLQELIPTSAASRSFGADVSISGDRIAVSDPGAPGVGGTGAVFIFDRLNPIGFFSETARFTAPTTGSRNFGRSIDLEGNRLAASYSVPVPPPSLNSRDALAVIDGITGGPLSIRSFVGELGDPATAVGRKVALGEGEVLTTSTYVTVGNAIRLESALRRFSADDPVIDVCDGSPNSTGARGLLDVEGCATTTELPLRASQLPQFTFGLPVLGTTEAMIPISNGFLCIGDPLRGPIVQADGTGVMTVRLNPTHFGFAPGDVIRAQLWHRDTPAASNLTGAIRFELAP